MRNKLLIIILLLCSYSSCYSHKEWVHQYIVKEAYQFLENEIGEITELKNYLGLNYYGKSDWNDCPWEQNGAVAIGSWREDLFDPVWYYGAWFNGWTASCTHFWQADNGDDFQMYVTGTGNVPNAWKKARMYFFGRDEYNSYKFEHEGNYELNWKKDGYWQYARAATIIRSYQCLFDFYKYGYSRLIGYRSTYTYLSKEIINKDVTMVESARKKYTYHILGRIAHLLADMSVPAHVHNDEHPCELGMGDIYELWLGGNTTSDCNSEKTIFPTQSWNATTARHQGGLFKEVLSMNDRDALRYIFYSLNQVTDHYPSWCAGDICEFSTPIYFGNNSLVNGTTPYLTNKYIELGLPPYNPEVYECADQSLNYCIRATATLFYWFCVRMGLVDCPDALYLQNDKFYGMPNSYQTAYFEASNQIFAGNNVRPSLPQGDYVIESTANASFKAGNEIRLEDGFSAIEGADFVAFIDPYCYTYNTTSCYQELPTKIQSNSSKKSNNEYNHILSDDIYQFLAIQTLPNELIVYYQNNDTIIVKPWYLINYKLYDYQESLLDSTLVDVYTDSIRTFNADTIHVISYQDSLLLQLNSDSTYFYHIVLSTSDSVATIIKSYNNNQNIIRKGDVGLMNHIISELNISPTPSSNNLKINSTFLVVLTHHKIMKLSSRAYQPIFFHYYTHKNI